MTVPSLVRVRPHWRLLAGAGAAGVAYGVARPLGLTGESAFVFAWDAYVVTVLVLLGLAVRRADPDHVREIATREDPGRVWTFAFVVFATTISLFAVVGVLAGAKDAPGAIRWERTALSLVAVAGSWTLLHTVYAFRYAHLYYREEADGRPGALTFPGNEPLDYGDFVYFSYCLGMTFQTSDVSIPNRVLRRAVTGHTLLCFVFNTAVLAMALNTVAGLV